MPPLTYGIPWEVFTRAGECKNAVDQSAKTHAAANTKTPRARIIILFMELPSHVPRSRYETATSRSVFSKALLSLYEIRRCKPSMSLRLDLILSGRRLVAWHIKIDKVACATFFYLGLIHC